MQPEDYLTYIDGNMSEWYLPSCPFIIPRTTTFQSILMTAILYRLTVDLQKILEKSGGKMDEESISALRHHINESYLETISFKASVEN